MGFTGWLAPGCISEHQLHQGGTLLTTSPGSGSLCNTGETKRERKERQKRTLSFGLGRWKARWGEREARPGKSEQVGGRKQVFVFNQVR